ncbi:MAG TPA: MotB family protein [Hyphomicrobiaceae bacterium]|nr:MotB family protein [Hyphomicrobiaceae bacterium]
MSTTEDTSTQELVIIRRRANGEEAAHKGGVWKIAYADFMTAMMAFFLVMWLINASDKQTLIQIATYFNPLRLTDRVTSTRGVHNLESGARGQEENSGNAKDKAGTTTSDKKAEAGTPKQTEEALFKDPYGILSKLAVLAKRNDAEDQSRPAPKIEIGESLISGEAYRDPFEPRFRKESTGKSPEGKPAPEAARPDAGAAAAALAHGAPSDALVSAAPPVPSPPAQSVEPEQANRSQAGSSATPEAVGGAPDRDAAGLQAAWQSVRRDAQEQAAERAKIEQEIKEAIQQAALGIVPNIDVTVTEDGVLISLTDRFDFGMFRISSAEPRPETVVVMERIARIIAPRGESLIVRGHTDGRPFKSGTYDNWRLSTARAHMAYHMLVRGGVSEQRFERVEGYADRSLKVPDDPGAASNRRIEILLRRPKS